MIAVPSNLFQTRSHSCIFDPYHHFFRVPQHLCFLKDASPHGGTSERLRRSARTICTAHRRIRPSLKSARRRSASWSELGLNRAALRHTNEMYDEKEEEFSTPQERHPATEMYVEELRTRTARSTEREAFTKVSLLILPHLSPLTTSFSLFRPMLGISKSSLNNTTNLT